MANELIKTNQNEIIAVDNYNPNFGNIRNIIVDEEVWLCGLDVCDVLGYADAPKILKYHVKEAERKKFPISSHGQNRKMVFINANGFYDLCQGSKLPAADQIKEWIKTKFFINVDNANLPAVTINYLTNNDDFVNKVSNQVADRIIEKAANYDTLKGSKSLIPMKDVADTLAIPGIGRNTLFKILRIKNILNEENKPYREYIENGWFKSVENEYTTKSGVHVSFTTKATVKGLENIRRLLKEWGYC